MQKPNNKSEEYLEYIRGLPCVITGRQGSPHHLHHKDNDFLTVPLDIDPHSNDVGQKGKNQFWVKRNLDERDFVIENLIGFIKQTFDFLEQRRLRADFKQYITEHREYI
jgi:hypothetical protein